MTATELADVLAHAQALLLDFDGPVCSVFAGLPASQVADELRPLLPDEGARLPTDASPHDLLTYSVRFGPAVVRRIEDQLTDAEIRAVETAQPTPGADKFIASTEGRLALAIVSNNSDRAVAKYLTKHQLADFVQHIEGRDPTDPALMKPNPHTLLQTAADLQQPTSACVMLGDSVTDIAAAAAAHMPSIGFANRPAKRALLAEAGASIIVRSLSTLTKTVRQSATTPPA